MRVISWFVKVVFLLVLVACGLLAALAYLSPEAFVIVRDEAQRVGEVIAEELNLPGASERQLPELDGTGIEAGRLYDRHIRGEAERAYTDMDAEIGEALDKLNGTLRGAQERTEGFVQELGRAESGTRMRRPRCRGIWRNNETVCVGVRHGEREWSDANEEALQSLSVDVLYDGEHPYARMRDTLGEINGAIERYQQRMYQASTTAVTQLCPTMDPLRISEAEYAEGGIALDDTQDVFVAYLRQVNEQYMRHDGGGMNEAVFNAMLSDFARNPGHREARSAEVGARWAQDATMIAYSVARGSRVVIAEGTNFVVERTTDRSLLEHADGLLQRVAGLSGCNALSELASNGCDDLRESLTNELNASLANAHEALVQDMFSQLLCPEGSADEVCHFGSPAASRARLLERVRLVTEASVRTRLHQLVILEGRQQGLCAR